jgi:hypothetical protein
MTSSRAKPHESSTANERYEGEQAATGCGRTRPVTLNDSAARRVWSTRRLESEITQARARVSE